MQWPEAGGHLTKKAKAQFFIVPSGCLGVSNACLNEMKIKSNPYSLTTGLVSQPSPGHRQSFPRLLDSRRGGNKYIFFKKNIKNVIVENVNDKKAATAMIMMIRMMVGAVLKNTKP